MRGPAFAHPSNDWRWSSWQGPCPPLRCVIGGLGHPQHRLRVGSAAVYHLLTEQMCFALVALALSISSIP